MSNDMADRRPGSSPHVRGAQGRSGFARQHRGIIPACAGSTSPAPEPPPRTRDHPRMCGEHHSLRRRQWIPPGSSPHVRGAPGRSSPRSDRTGIIPACAGSTQIMTVAHIIQRDHPRMCGEHLPACGSMYAPTGSSPHVRGARSISSRWPQEPGIIPACAGSTKRSRGRSCRSRDHPRMCGEHAMRGMIFDAKVGSSPHVRGAHCGFALS